MRSLLGINRRLCMKKLKIYLDTNTIIDFFINEARTLRKGEKPRVTKKFEFMTEKSTEVDFITSFISKAEIARELSAAYALTENEINRLWDTFIDSISCKYINNFHFDDKIVEIPMKMKVKLRTLFNFMHLFIAIKENAYFLSGDKDIVDIVKAKKIYGKALTYIELRKMF